MKSILLIGKFNTFFHDINEELGKRFAVQACTDSAEMMKDFLRLKTPDIVVISMIGMGKEHNRIFSELKYNYAQLPAVCIGTQSERNYFQEYMLLKQFHGMERPVDSSGISQTVMSLVGLAADETSDIYKTGEHTRKTILLVDDNAIQLRTLSKLLSDKYDVHLATSGMKALLQIGKHVPDIIFLDYEMPVCDGRMTLKMIRETEEAKDVPVVFLTGVKDAEHIRAVLELNPAGYMLKPASLEKLEEVIQRVLGEQISSGKNRLRRI